jgi:hypothetical protein
LSKTKLIFALPNRLRAKTSAPSIDHLLSVVGGNLNRFDLTAPSTALSWYISQRQGESWRRHRAMSTMFKTSSPFEKNFAQFGKDANRFSPCRVVAKPGRAT